MMPKAPSLLGTILFFSSLISLPMVAGQATVALDAYGVLFDVIPASNQVRVQMSFTWRVNKEPHDFATGYHSVLDPTPRKQGATIQNAQVFGDDLPLSSRQYLNGFGWDMVEWTFDPKLSRVGETQVIRLEYTIANANHFLTCRSPGTAADDGVVAETLRLSAPWLNYWKTQMPTNVTYAIQLPMDQVNSETASVVAVHPLPRSSGLGTTMLGSPTSSVTYQSKELWFCAGAGRCCGFEDTGRCASDPQPFWIDFEIVWENSDEGSPCTTSSSAATRQGFFEAWSVWLLPLTVFALLHEL
ncbi:expressed unknown protein [Seminavis robusta]|uniref:Uncharacterized protein n=1 Tax=Seminavis robusta TaxID=568900 RepID=A0A9N8HUT3_9STRA|nr:expressed unknown protein [Seminavis robusta]|eukprot:Sro1870_g302730.1 n/a (300) ;mRNA; r:11560-12459